MLIIETVAGKTFYHKVQLTGGDGGQLGNKEVRLVAVAARHFAVGKIKYSGGQISDIFCFEAVFTKFHRI